MSGAVEARLAELGLKLPEVAAPLTSYAPAVVTGHSPRYVYTAGQLPMIEGKLPATGKVGSEVSPEQARELARTCTLNGLAAIRYAVGDLDRIAQVVRVVGFVASAPHFTGQPGVLNGASELLGEIFGDRGVHARSAVGVAVLPIDSPVEVELQVELVD